MILLNGHIDERPLAAIWREDSNYPHQAVYTALRTYNKKPFRLEDHIDRLKESAAIMQLKNLPEKIDQIRSWIQQILGGSEKEQFIIITVTPDNIVLASEDLEIDPSIYEGVRVIAKPVVRSPAKAKFADNAEQRKAYEEARKEMAYEALLLDEEKNVITEGSRSNILWVKNGVLFWCDEALSGITQKTVLELAGKLKIPVQESSLSVDDILEMDELFLTQTSRGIVPITSLDVLKIREGQVGPMTRQLMKAFDELTSAW